MNHIFLRSFRLVCKASETSAVEGLLHEQGFIFEPEPFSPLARRLLHEPVPLGSSLAASFGFIYIQDRSSMLPPLALNPEAGSAVLDMCASPGSKTGFLGQLVGMNGFVLGNEPSRNRLATLRANLSNLNLFNCATASHPGEQIPLPGGTWGNVLLDPPCSGWGTVEKNPGVMRLWQGERVEPLIDLQKKLLKEAARLLSAGGKLAYSTCTTNVRENEEQVRFACAELGFELVSLAAPPGFAFAPVELDGMEGCLRVETGGDGQGFFIALLQKTADVADMEPEKSIWENVETSRTRSFGKKGRISAEPSRGPVQLSRGFSDDPWVDALNLPPGIVADFNGIAHFMPKLSSGLLPDKFPWKGFPLGRAAPGGGIRVNPALRGLMPDREEAERRGLPCLDIGDLSVLSGLLRGRSLEVELPGKEAGLYYNGLPLCRLALKGRRVIMPKL